MTTATATTPAAWVGCLGCYNEGNLVGRWLNTPDAIRAYRCPNPVSIYNFHEELWVFDHEAAPFVDGEVSPSEFADRLEAFEAAVERLDHEDHAPAIVGAYIANTGPAWVDWDTLADNVEEAYIGHYDSVTHYAEAFAEETHEDLDEMPFASYINWEAYGRDLVLSGDIWSAEIRDAYGVLIFRGNV